MTVKTPRVKLGECGKTVWVVYEVAKNPKGDDGKIWPEKR
jgi:hypothetical protein